MMFIRTHYFIDMVTGVVIAHYFHRLAEKLCFFIDVKVLRQHVTKPNKRERWHFKPCSECGWGNKRATNYLSENERGILELVYHEQKAKSHEAKMN
jgi:hypothetical protein